MFWGNKSYSYIHLFLRIFYNNSKTLLKEKYRVFFYIKFLFTEQTIIQKKSN